MGFYKAEDTEDCKYFYLECNVCGKTEEGNELELLEKGWSWSKIESQSTEKRSVVRYLATITVAVCPEHDNHLGKILLDKMYSIDENPPVG